MEKEWLTCVTPPSKAELLRWASPSSPEEELSSSEDAACCMLCTGRYQVSFTQFNPIIQSNRITSASIHLNNVGFNLFILQPLNSVSRLRYSGQKQLNRQTEPRSSICCGLVRDHTLTAQNYSTVNTEAMHPSLLHFTSFSPIKL